MPFPWGPYVHIILLYELTDFSSFFAGFAVFAFLGFMSCESGIDIKDVATSGPGLAFLVYPKGITLMPQSPIWSVAFFTMILILGIGSQVCFNYFLMSNKLQIRVGQKIEIPALNKLLYRLLGLINKSIFGQFKQSNYEVIDCHKPPTHIKKCSMMSEYFFCGLNHHTVFFLFYSKFFLNFYLWPKHIKFFRWLEWNRSSLPFPIWHHLCNVIVESSASS